MNKRSIISNQDKSVNFIFEDDNGMLEARYVRREDKKLIVYLSSQYGCKQACRFCHLTQTKQVSDVCATQQQYVDQALAVLDHYDQTLYTCPPAIASRINYNFMARGEPLANPNFYRDPIGLFNRLSDEAWTRGAVAKFNISTIIPADILIDTSNAFLVSQITHNHQIYYSMYSVNPGFRSKWLPKAADPRIALSFLQMWQHNTGRDVVFHHAFIEGENDSIEDVEKFLEIIQPYHLSAKFNCVRYNPFSDQQGKESSEEVIQRNFNMIAKEMSAPGSRIVPRVGFDVKASCGMFIEPSKGQTNE